MSVILFCTMIGIGSAMLLVNNINIALSKYNAITQKTKNNITSIDVNWTADNDDRRVVSIYLIEESDYNYVLFSVGSLDNPICGKKHVGRENNRRVVFDDNHINMVTWCQIDSSNTYKIWIKAKTDEGNEMIFRSLMDPAKDSVTFNSFEGYDVTIPTSKFRNSFERCDFTIPTSKVINYF